jgi:hypothetical protein
LGAPLAAPGPATGLLAGALPAAFSCAIMVSIRLLSMPPIFILLLLGCYRSWKQPHSGFQNISSRATTYPEEAPKGSSISPFM